MTSITRAVALGDMLRKRASRLMAKSFPLNQVRVRALRSAGYRVGKSVHLGEDFLVIDELEGAPANLSIGERVAIGPRVMVVLVSHPNDSKLGARFGVTTGAVTIADDAWIGAGAIILRGVTIGEQAVVGAGSVVTGSVPPGTVVAGIPARVLRAVDAEKDGEKDGESRAD